MSHFHRSISISVLFLSLTACSGAIVGDLAESNFRDEPDELRDSCRPNDDDCVPGLTDSLLEILTKRITENANTPSGGQISTTKGTLSEADIKAITKKPNDQKTARDREIEALLEELLQQRRERIAREKSS